MAEKKKTSTKSTGGTKKTPAKKNTGKKSTSSKSAQAAAPQVKKDYSNVGLCISLIVALLFLLMLFIKDMAIVGDYLRPFIMGLVGLWGMAAVPLYLINLIRTWYKDRRNNKVASKWFVSALSFLLLLAAIHGIFAGGGELSELNGDMFGKGKEGIGSGVIGGYFYAALCKLIGNIATSIFIWATLLLTLPLLFDSTPLSVLRAMVRGIRSVMMQVQEVEPVDEPAPEEKEEPVKQTGRSGVELREPPVEPKKAKENKRKAALITEDDLPVTEIATIPEQIEINRTRTPKAEKEQPLYEEIPSAEAVEPEVADEPKEGAETQKPSIDDILAALIDEPIQGTEPTAEEATEPAAEVAETPAVDTEPDWESLFADDDTAAPTEEAIPVEVVADSTPVEVEGETIKAEQPYMFPPLTLLAPKERGGVGMSPEESRRTSELLIDTLSNFGVGAKLINTSHGPTVTRFELQPDTGVRVRKISNLSDDIALHLAATSVRIEAPIPGKSAVGIEIPNKNKSIVRLRELLEDYAYKNSKSNLLCCLGMDVVGNPVHLDVSKMPHLLIAGATGMGKSVCINSLIVSLLYRARPDEVKLILIDPKKVEFADYNGIPHLLVPVVTEPKKAAGSLSWAVMEMERRFSEIQEVGARNLEEYNEFTADDPEKEYIPQVVIIIDELADLMMTAPSEVENSICRLAQKARAAGMYLIIGTQRPSVDVITGLIKANIPSRIACKVASQVDSRTILDITGAEKLLGKGDMLYNPVGATKPLRVQGAFVEGREVISVCTYLRQAAQAQYSEDVMQIIEKEAQLCGEKGSKRSAAEADTEDSGSMDPLELDALEIGIECESISTSLLQRRLSIGYARAARIIDKLEQKGLVSSYDSTAKKRVVTISKESFLQMKMNAVDAEAGE